MMIGLELETFGVGSVALQIEPLSLPTSCYIEYNVLHTKNIFYIRFCIIRL